MSKNKPGVMIYFEISRAIKKLSYEQKGCIFEAILSYAEFGEVPEFDDITLDVLWPLLAQKIDRDTEKYNAISDRRRRNIYIRWWKEYAEKNGINPDDGHAMNDWIELHMCSKDTNVSTCIQTIPTTPPSTTATETPSAAVTATVPPSTTEAGNVSTNESKTVSETGAGKGSGGNRVLVKPMSGMLELKNMSNDAYAEQDRLRAEKIAMLKNSSQQ